MTDTPELKLYGYSRNKVHGKGVYIIKLRSGIGGGRYIWNIYFANPRKDYCVMIATGIKHSTRANCAREAAFFLRNEAEVVFQIPGYKPFIAEPEDLLDMNWYRFMKYNNVQKVN